jgi:transaldolase
MAANLLEQLKTMSTVVADTGDMHSMKQYRPQDATTNPSLILGAAEKPEYAELVDGALRWARGQGGSTTEMAARAADRLAIEFGLKILEIVPGRVSTEVDARLSHDVDRSIAKARQIIAQYEHAGVEKKRILIKLASTWEGVRAAEVLEREGIHCNMTLLFGLHQAIACADAKATLISPFVGRILDWYKKHERPEGYPAAEDPGVVSVTTIYTYYKKFGIATEVMGASFRSMAEIVELAGCDLLTISPQFLGELQAAEGTLERKLEPARARAARVEAIKMDRATFDRMHEENRMAKDKLAEGIDGFAKAAVQLEERLAARLAALAS